MKITYIEVGYAEKRTHDYKSLEVSQKVGCTLDEGENVTEARKTLFERVKQHTILLADEAELEFTMRIDDEKAEQNGREQAQIVDRDLR